MGCVPGVRQIVFLVHFLYTRSSLLWEVGGSCDFISHCYGYKHKPDSWHSQQGCAEVLRPFEKENARTHLEGSIKYLGKGLSI